MRLQDQDFPRSGTACPGAASSTINFDARVGGFVVSDSALIAEILRSAAFHVVDYARHFQEMAERTGLDFDASVDAMRHMPLANEGRAHRQLRTRSARAISEHWREDAAAMERFISQLSGDVFAEGEVDLVSQFAIPVFNHLYRLWSGVALNEEMGIAQVFCGRMSLNRRRQLDAAIGRLHAALDGNASRFPNDVAMSFAILASDSLVGSLSLSLWTLFFHNNGRRISEIRFPETLPSTAVPYVDRIAVADVEILGQTFGKGDRVRLMLQCTAHGSPEGDLFFGAGRHLCVGKSMTNIIWKSIASCLAPVEFRVTALDLIKRRPDHVFDFPQSARVRIHA